jgi:threonine dehydratase
MTEWPIAFTDVLAARERLRPFLVPTPLRGYAPLDAAVGAGIRVLVKHENHQPTNAFKIRNGVAVLTALDADARRRVVVAASRGNHGLVCLPVGNNPEKNEALRGLGATLVEKGRDYDEAVEVARHLARERGFTLVHATNDPRVLAGAATLALEMLEEAPELEALVIGVGGGSQAVGALTAARGLGHPVAVYGVQAQRAAAIHDSWHAGRALPGSSADTFADGLATRNVYELTFDALREGLADFVAVTEEKLADALRILLRTTHNLVEGAGAAGLAGLLRLRDRLAGRSVGIVLSGANIDQATLRRVLCGEL